MTEMTDAGPMNNPDITDKPKPPTGIRFSDLLGTVWRHKKKGGIYRVTQVAEKRGNVYLLAETKGCRSTWKAECLLPFDYEQVSNAAGERPGKPTKTE